MAIMEFNINFLVLLMSVVLAAESKDLRKVIVKEIRFSIYPQDHTANASVKNGIDNEANAPNIEIFKSLILDEISRTERENTMLKQYHEHLRKDPYLNKLTKFHNKPVNSDMKDNGSDKIALIEDESGKDVSRTNKIDHTNEPFETKDRKNSVIDRIDNDKHVNFMKDVDESFDLPDDLKEDGEIKTFESESIQKIVGGSLSMPNTWTWQVSIQYYGDDEYWHHFCGGSLITEQWVVTAAHCVSKLDSYTIRVVLGDYRLSIRTHREQIIAPSRILMHGYYEDNSYYFDIAMVKLSVDAKYTTYVQNVEMVSPETVTLTSDDLCYIVGWGNTIGTTERVYVSDFLMEGRVSVITQTACRRVYGNMIEETQICVLGDHASACSGDSGGPLTCRVGGGWKLAGIASWVGSATCSEEYPNVYTRMSTFSEWAESLMNQY